MEYVAATVRKLAQEAAAEGVRRLFLISVSANLTPKPKLNLSPAGRSESPFSGRLDWQRMLLKLSPWCACRRTSSARSASWWRCAT